MTYDEMSPTRLDLTGTFGLRVADRDVAEVRVGTLGRWGQRVNLATNPSFETLTGASVVVRTNLALRPQPIPAYWTQVLGTNGAGALAFGTHPTSGRPRALATWSTAPTAGSAQVSCGTAAAHVPVTEGTTYAFSVEVEKTAPMAMYPMISWCSDAAWLGDSVGATSTGLDPTREYVVGTAPVGATGALLLYRASSVDRPSMVGTVMLGDALFEASPVLGDYFDGDTSLDPDLTPAWTGPVHGSTSTLSGAVIVGRNSMAGEVRQFSSGQHVTAGLRSKRIMWLASTATSATTWVDTDYISVPVGRTARVTFDLHLPDDVTIAIARAGGQATISFGRFGAGRVQVIVPVDTTSNRLTLSTPQHYTPSMSAWLDAWMVEDVTDLATEWSTLPDPKPTLDAWLDERLGTDAWDGDTENTARALHHWTGPRHGSTSVQTLAWSPE